MLEAIKGYFKEFGVLKETPREFWAVNLINFLDGLAYFSMITIITLYLSENLKFDDQWAGNVVGGFTFLITFFLFFVGFIVDSIGIKKSLTIGVILLLLSRIGLSFVPSLDAAIESSGISFTLGRFSMPQLIAIFLLAIMALGTALMSPVITAATRRYTGLRTRGTGFNMLYLTMNVGAIMAGFVIDWLRLPFGNESIFFFGFIMSILCWASILFMIKSEKQVFDKNPNAAEEKQEPEKKEHEEKKQHETPWAIAASVIKEPAFWKFMLFLLILIGVKLVFVHQFMVMPKYYTRVLGADAPIGKLNAVNPTIIVIGLIAAIPILNKFKVLSLIVVGTFISALSVFVLIVPGRFFNSFGMTTEVGYWITISVQIIIFAIGEVIWSPRLYEYTASIAPPGREGSYMSLSTLPMFMAKPLNGVLSGYLLSRYCPEGIISQLDTVSFWEGPEFMWLALSVISISSPILIVLLKDFLGTKEVEENKI